MAQGKYIVIEGHDGTGKSTQVEMLRDRLANQGIESQTYHEPAGTPMADEIRSVLKNGKLERHADTNILLFTAARTEIWRDAVEKMNKGIWILSARNYYSTLVYQGHGEGMDADKILEVTKNFVGAEYMNTDWSCILSIEDAERESRIKQRGKLEHPDTFESRDNNFQDRVNTGYLVVADKFKIPVIPADNPVEYINNKIVSMINSSLQISIK